MVGVSKLSRLGIVSLLLPLKTPYVSAVIINVVVSEVDEVWRENSDESLRRKDPGGTLESVIRLCRPPPDEPWLGVYAIDPKVTSCEQQGGGSPNWVIRESEWERPEFLPKPPGTLLQIEGPGPEGPLKPLPITNTDEKEDYLTFGPMPGLHESSSEPSKWVVERFGNNNNYETLTPKNLLRVGDTLRFWDPSIPNGFQQLYMHRIKGSPQRFNRLRPIENPEDRDDEDYGADLAQIRREYPTAEFRVASLGEYEIVGPGAPSLAQLFFKQVGRAKSSVGKFLTRKDDRSQPHAGQIDTNEKIPPGKGKIRGKGSDRVRSEDLGIKQGDVLGNLDPPGSPEEFLQRKASTLASRPQSLKKSMRKIQTFQSPDRSTIPQFEESKENINDDVRRPSEMDRSRSSNTESSKMSESGRGRTMTTNMKGSQSETEYQTAYGESMFDPTEEDRLGDIIEKTEWPAYDPDTVETGGAFTYGTDAFEGQRNINVSPKKNTKEGPGGNDAS